MGLDSQCLSPKSAVSKRLRVSVVLCHSFLFEKILSNPPPPEATAAGRAAVMVTCELPDGERLSVTQLPEVSVNVSERRKTVRCSGKD